MNILEIIGWIVIMIFTINEIYIKQPSFYFQSKVQNKVQNKGKVNIRTLFSIGLLISFFLPWIDLRLFTVSGYDLPLSMEKLERLGNSNDDSAIIFYFLYLIPAFAVYNIFNDFTQSKKLSLLNEFVVGIIVSFFGILIAVLEKKTDFLSLGFYTTVIFSVLGLFSKFFTSSTPSVVAVAADKATGLVQKGMKYQAEGNYSEAFVCFYEATKQNDTIAYNRLGELYEKGLGVEKNIDMAIKWYEKAAELGDVEAKMRLEILNQNIYH
jgi:hypothetical protein